MNWLVAHYKSRADRRDDKHRLKFMRSLDTLQLNALRHGGFPSSVDEKHNVKLDVKMDAVREVQLPVIENDKAIQKLPKHFPDPPALTPPTLPKPVLVPQRRQGDRLRGFQLLYSPELANCGVAEQDFVAFLNTLNAAIGYDDKAKIMCSAIDIAAISLFIWEVNLTAMCIRALTTGVIRLKSRVKSQAYVEHANERFFHPRGLHVQIVRVASLKASSQLPSALYGAEEESCTTKNGFQFSIGAPDVDADVKGGLFKMDKRPIEYDPFDYGSCYAKILPSQYCSLRPTQLKEPATSFVAKLAERVEVFDVWRDRFAAKRSAKKQAKRERKAQEAIERVREKEGETGLEQYLRNQQVKGQKRRGKARTMLEKVLGRGKVVLIITNLDYRPEELGAAKAG